MKWLLDKYPSAGDGLEGHQVAFWIAQALLIGYHGDEKRFKQDIAAIRESGSVPLDEFRKNLRRQAVKTEIKSAYEQLDDLDYPISRGDTLFIFIYALLRWKGAVSFPSNRPIQATRVSDISDLEDAEADRPLSADPILQEHHIYPAALLRKELDENDDDWFDKRWINDIASITFLLGDDNFGLGDSPIDYLDDIDSTRRAQHMIGSKRYRTGEYRSFLADRRKLMKKALMEFFAFLEKNAGA